MKFVALLSYFDESPEWLYECVSGLVNAGVTDLVACDGRYPLYPSEADQSPDSNYEAIESACQETGIVLHYHSLGVIDEVAKRSRMFEIAEGFTTPDDRYFVIDADEFVEKVDGVVNLEGDVATAMLWEPDTGETIDLRCIFRAIRGLRVHHNHHTFASELENKVLWGARGEYEEPAVESNIVLSHRTHMRDELRHGSKMTYYAARDSQGIEKFRCHFCGRWDDSKRVPYNWYMNGTSAESHWYGCCSRCNPKAMRESEQQFYELTGRRINLVVG